MRAARGLATLLAGALFGFGLSYATMIRPEVVLSFLRFQDFGLMLVMGGAVLVVLLAYQLAPRWLARPLLDDHFHSHPSVWNRDTLVGAALFGVPVRRLPRPGHCGTRHRQLEPVVGAGRHGVGRAGARAACQITSRRPSRRFDFAIILIAAYACYTGPTG